MIFFRYNELRVFMGDPSAMDGRALVAQRKAEREKAYKIRPREWIGTVTQSQLDFPYLNLWGFPDKFNRKAAQVAGQITGIGGSPGVVEGIARVVLPRGPVRPGPGGRHPRLPDDQPGLGRAVHQDHRPGDRCGRHRLAPGRARRVSSASRACVGTSVATQQIKNGDRIRVNGTTGLVEILEKAALPRNDLFAV